MKKLVLGVTFAAIGLSAAPAVARDTPWEANREYRHDVRKAEKDYRKDMRKADNWREAREARREYQDDIREARQERAEDMRDWRRYGNYDWNRVEQGQGRYYADRYYRDGRYYQPRRLAQNDRIYRGYNGQYYCRRDDGTTGLILGGVAGGVLGNVIAPGESKTIGTILGAGAGALLGRAIDKDGVNCR